MKSIFDFSGVHNISETAYRAAEGVNVSSLKSLMCGPEVYYREEIEGKNKKGSASMSLGTLAHCLLLEPHLFEAQYNVVEPLINPKTEMPYGPGTKKQHDHYEERYQEGKITVGTCDVDHARIMVYAMQKNPIGSLFINAMTASELILMFDSTDYGLPMKCMLDSVTLFDTNIKENEGKEEAIAELYEAIEADYGPINGYAGVIWDYKTTGDWFRIKSHSRDFGYHRQASQYSAMAEHVFGGPFLFYNGFSDTTDYYRSRVIRFNDDDIARGKEECERCYDELHKRFTSGDWHNEKYDKIEQLNLYKGTGY